MLQLMVACGCYELMCDALVKNAGEKLEILGLRQRHLRTEKAQVGKVLGLEEPGDTRTRILRPKLFTRRSLFHCFNSWPQLYRKHNCPAEL